VTEANRCLGLSCAAIFRLPDRVSHVEEVLAFAQIELASRRGRRKCRKAAMLALGVPCDAHERSGWGWLSRS
jgi:hypothetical protein